MSFITRDHLIQILEFLHRPVPVQGANEAVVMVSVVTAVRKTIQQMDDAAAEAARQQSEQAVIAAYLEREEANRKAAE